LAASSPYGPAAGRPVLQPQEVRAAAVPGPMNTAAHFWGLRSLQRHALPAAAQACAPAAASRGLLTGTEEGRAWDPQPDISEGCPVAPSAVIRGGNACGSGREAPQQRTRIQHFSNKTWEHKTNLWTTSRAILRDLKYAEHISISNIAFAVERMGYYATTGPKAKGDEGHVRRQAYLKVATKALRFLGGMVHSNPAILEGITGNDLSRLLWGLAMLQTSNYPFTFDPDLLTDPWQWQHIDEATIRTAQEMKPKRLAKILWAYSRVGHRCPVEVLAALRDSSATRISELSAWELANVAGAMVRMEYMPGEDFLVSCTAAALIKGQEEFSPWGLGMIMHCFAMCGWDPGPAMMQLVDTHVLTRSQEYSTRELANMTWAFACLGHYPEDQELRVPGDPSLPTSLDKIMEEVVFRGPGALGATDVAQLLWAMGSLQYRPSLELMRVLLAAVEACMRDFKPEELVNVLWGISVVEARQVPSRLLKMAAKHALDKAGSLSPQQLSNFLLAYAKLTAQPSSTLLRSFEARMREILPKFNGQDTATALHAFSRLHHDLATDVLQGVEVFAVHNLQLLTTEEVTKIMCALARMGYVPTPELLQQVSHRLENDNTFTQRELDALEESLPILTDLCESEQEDGSYFTVPQFPLHKESVVVGEDLT